MTLGLWLGVHSLRAYLAMSVWNLADPLPLHLKSILPTAVYAVALLGYPAARLVGRERAYRVFGLGFAAAYALRQWFGGSDPAAAVLALAAFVLFMWWLPVVFQLVADSGQRALVAPAAALAIALQVAGQTLLHGLDVHLLRGTGGYIIATALAGGLAYAVLTTQQPKSAEAPQPVARGIVALLGFWLFLELTLFAHPGRIQEVAGMGATGAMLLILLGLAAGVAISSANLPIARVLAGGLLLLAVVLTELGGTFTAAILLVGQVAAYITLAGAWSRGDSVNRVFAHGAALAGGALLFVLIFGYYTRYEATGLWSLAAVGLALFSLGSGTPVPQTHRAVALLIAVIVAVSAAGAQIPARTQPITARATLRVMSYNVHQGYDAAGLPNAPALAEVIAREQPDYVALQEVGRGWNLLGGADLVGYFRWRLPEYEVLFGPTNGRLWGNAVLVRGTPSARHAITFSTSEAFRYGALRVQFADLALTSVHLSADLDSAVERIRVRQVAELLAAVPAARSIIAGDFNAEPASTVIAALHAAGFVDATAASAAAVPTWREQRLDYIFASPDLRPSGARILTTDASDHRPVVVDFKRE